LENYQHECVDAMTIESMDDYVLFLQKCFEDENLSDGGFLHWKIGNYVLFVLEFLLFFSCSSRRCSHMPNAQRHACDLNLTHISLRNLA
jgi:hypothetical protein